MRKITFGIIALSAVALAGCNKTSTPAITNTATNTQTQQSSTGSSDQQNGATITYDGKAFNPASITVKKGTAVTWTNNSDKSVWIASNPHPTHTGLPGLDELRGMVKGESYSYTFDKSGSFGYHNHLNPSAGGTVTVEE